MAAPDLSRIEPDLVHPQTYVDTGYPHDVWTTLRQQSPVHWVERSQGESFWAITKHADIAYVGKNPELFISSPTLFVPFEDEDPDAARFEAPPTLISLDPPLHHKYRQIINKRFTPRALRQIHQQHHIYPQSAVVHRSHP